MAAGDATAFVGRWVGLQGEYVATVEHSAVVWPNGSRSEVELVEGGGIRVTVEGDEMQAWLAPEGRIEWSDGDVWLRDVVRPAVEVAPAAPAVPNAPAAPAPAAPGMPAAKRRAAAGRGSGRGRGGRGPRKPKAAAELREQVRFTITNPRKVAVLQDSDVNSMVVAYLQPGAEFSVAGATKRDGRSYLRLTDKSGWVPTHSRKDRNKLVVTEVPGSFKDLDPELDEAPEVPPAAGAKQTRRLPAGGAEGGGAAAAEPAQDALAEDAPTEDAPAATPTVEEPGQALGKRARTRGRG